MSLIKDIKGIMTYHAGATVGHILTGFSTGTSIILDPIIVLLKHRDEDFMRGFRVNSGFKNGFGDSVIGPLKASVERFESTAEVA